MTTTLTYSRSDRKKRALLAEQMGIVQDCLATSRTATARLAQALQVIHDAELYLLTHKSFEEFCEQEFDLTRSRGYQLLDFAKVVEHICANNCGHLAIPERESHARLLAPLALAQQIEAARLVQETLNAEGRSTPSAADFENAVRTLGGDSYAPDPRNAETLPSEDGDGDDPPRDNGGGAATPQWLFDYCNQLAVQACGEAISLDVAAADWNYKCARYFTETDDGLRQGWDAKAVWCNPPYSATIIEAFVRKGLEAAPQGTTSFFLVPWWNYPYLDLCEKYGRIHRICNPVCFKREDGTTLTMNNQYRTTPLIVVAFGPTIRPGCGEPIRKGSMSCDNQGQEEGGITARSLAGDGDHRREHDAYYTPPWAIDAILAAEKFDGQTWEPAEGDGRIVAALRQAGCDATGSDVATGTEFLGTTRAVDNIVTNPPWGLKTEFIRHAKECARRKVALLLPLSSLSGVARRPLFEDAAFPLRCVYVFERRLNFDPDAQGSTTLTTGWFVWERGYEGEPVLRWITES